MLPTVVPCCFLCKQLIKYYNSSNHQAAQQSFSFTGSEAQVMHAEPPGKRLPHELGNTLLHSPHTAALAPSLYSVFPLFPHSFNPFVCELPSRCSIAGFRVRWMKSYGPLAPTRLTFCLSRTGFWFSLSHCTISWHSGILLPDLNLSASSLEIWVRVHQYQCIFKLLVHASTHSGKREWCYSPPFLCH